jgi:hypothetical protein
VNFGKIINLFKKGGRAAPKGKGKGAFEWPAGIRIGVFGNANAGKTVYFTVLNEECKIARNLQISVTDNATSAEFLGHRREIWGLGTTSEVGTVVDLRGDQRFPESTSKDKALIFNAIIDGSKKVSVVTYDYPGKAVAISGVDDLRDKVMDFMCGCDGLLFFYDPKTMGSELQNQAQVSSFVSMLERLAPLKKRLPIPAALVVTKADVLPGFTGEGQAILIGAEDEHLLSEDFEFFLNKILTSNRIAADPAWAGTVRSVLIKLSDFLKVVVGRTLNFQIFFVSNTGQPPEKVGSDVGRSIYQPPRKIHPAGVREPFSWLLGAVLRNKAISKWRWVARLAFYVSLIWAVLYSLPFMIHFWVQLPAAESVEREVIQANNGNVLKASLDERRKVQTAFSRYENAFLTTTFFKGFQVPSARLRAFYRYFDISEAVRRLDNAIDRLTAIVGDSTRWPTINPSTDSLQLSPDFQSIIAGLEDYHVGDAASVLYARSGRVLRYWELFGNYLRKRGDTAVYRTLLEQVDFDKKTFGKERAGSEERLGGMLVERLKVQQIVQQRQQVAQQTAVNFDGFMAEVNANNDPKYRLETVVEQLTKMKRDLADPDAVRSVDNYLRQAKQWNERQTFTYRIETVPQGCHLHIEVTGRGVSPSWSVQTQMFGGDEYTVKWAPGDDIHVAIDELKHTCNWGKSPSDEKVLKGKWAVFDMQNISFENIGKQVSISFKPELTERLPKLVK